MLKQNAPSRKRPPPEPATSVDKKKAKEGPPLDPDWDPKEHYDMKREKFIDSEKFKTKQSDYRIKIKPFGTANFGEIRERLERIFQAIIDEARLMAAPNSRGHTLLTMNGVEKAISNYEININELKAEAILNKIEAILNSNQETSAEDFNMRFIFTEQPHGGISTPAFHNRSGPDLDPKVFRARKLALMDVAKEANDKMCLARCLYVGQHVADNPGNFRNTTKPNFKTIIDSRGSKQKLGARSLCRKADVSAYQESGITELQKFQDYLTNYQIICYESISGGTSICFPTEEMIEKQDKRIYLWLYKNHYTLINPNMLAGFHGTHYFCHNCLQAWDCVGIHKCEKAVCKLCKNVNCKNETSQADDTPLHCDECNCDYQSIQCHTSHKESKECDKKYYCERCRKTVSQKNKEPSLHHCLLNKCWYCNGFFEPGEHKCYVQRPKKKDLQVPEEEEDIHYLYGEFNEENGYEDDTLAAERKKKKYFYCDLECELNEDGQDKRHDTILFCMVSEDGTREWAYYGEDCMQQFFKEINENADFKDSTFVFHNFSGYDGIHMLKMFYDNGIDPRPLFRGCRVLSMSLRQLGIRFIDSFLHMSIPLAKFADCYDIKGAEKGKFPYNFATKANRDYVGPLPPIEFFDVENMLPEQKAEFLEWYLLEKAKYDADPTKVFDLRKEMLKYCMNDCHVLRKGFMKHRETMKLQNKGLEPADKITLPSYVNQVYRTNNMPKDSLAILPPRGYDQRGMQSTNALIWLLWLSKKYGYHIIHGRNSTEVKVGPFYLDGFTKTQFGIKKAFEYNGCPWHGCPDCYPDELADTEFRGKTYRQRQMNTKDKKEFLEARGYEVVSIYSCEFRRAQEIDPEMKEFVRKMKPRLQKAKPLAPRDCLRGGRTNAITMHYVPKVAEEIFYMDFTSLYPAVNCCLDDDQFYPVVFLKSCWIQMHFRQWMKYSVLLNAESCHPNSWPKAYKTEEDRRALVQRYKDEQDIDIPYESVYEIPNPAEKNSNKLTCNNFWGYLCKQAHGRTVRCTTYEQYLRHSNDKTKTVKNKWMIDENIMFMELEDKPEFEKIDPKTSIVHGIFTTAMARLKLFKEMEKTGRRTLYFDTDSVIWVHRTGEVDLETGPLLGQLTDEIFEKYGKKYGTNATIKEFAAAGPKTYALIIADKRTGETIDKIVKCKGIRLTVKALEVVNAETLIYLVKNNAEYKVPQVTMKRDKKAGTIVTKQGDKRLQVTFSKRIWPKNVDEPSLPIGWQE